MIERGGKLIAQVVQNTKQETIEPIIKANIKQGSNVFTDEWHAYKDLKKWYKHGIVNHGKGQYVKGEVHVNTAESFNNFLKGTLKGTHHNNISNKHLQKYLDEIVFRYNTRK
jgi:transposase-like protein